MVNKKNIGVERIALDFFLGVFLVLLSAYFVVGGAFYSGDANAGGTVNTTNEEVSTSFFNITLNMSMAMKNITNITQVNITLPANFTLISTGNGTSVSNGTDSVTQNFTISGSTLIWTNGSSWEHNLSTAVNSSYWFNATASAPGQYTFVVNIMNLTSNASFDLTIHVNDVEAPRLSFIGDTPAELSNISSSNVTINISMAHDGNSSLNYTNFTLYDNTGVVLNNSGMNSTDSKTSHFNISTIPDGLYYYVYIVANDSIGNENGTGAVGTDGILRNFSIDTAAPDIVLTRNDVSSTKNTLVIEVAATDATTGNNGIACTSNRGAATFTGGGTFQTFTEASLNCGASYEVTITCNDHAGNAGVATGTFKTNSCSSSGATGSGGGSSSGGSTTSWSTTYSHNNQDFSKIKKVERTLKEKQRVKIKINDEEHHIGVKSVSGSSAVIEVASTPQEATFDVGESNKFEVNGDNFYDIIVVLNSITDNKADVTVTSLHEEIPEDEIDDVQRAKETGSLDEPVAGEGAGEEKEKGFGGLIVSIIVLVVVLAGIGWFVYAKNKE